MSKNSRRARTERRSAERAAKKAADAASIASFNEAAAKAGSGLRATKNGVMQVGGNVGKSFAPPSGGVVNLKAATAEQLAQLNKYKAAEPQWTPYSSESNTRSAAPPIAGHIDNVRITKDAKYGPGGVLERLNAHKAEKIKPSYWQKIKAAFAKLFGRYDHV